MAETTSTPSSAASNAKPLGQLKIDRQAAGGAKQQPRRRKRWPLVAAGVLALAVIAMLAMPSKPEVQTSSVLQSTPSQQYLQLTASGYVVAQRRAAVASKATGRLLELNVREGTVLKKGVLIAKLDAIDVLAAIATAQAGVRQGEAGLRLAQAQQRQADVELA
ncbi:MAG: biotin/lipoyl-binding protein, partial [Burkholderiaceae bacterium]|nr:biotin/lipoyl-binding protein [Burkholderiaceae bacterium]